MNTDPPRMRHPTFMKEWREFCELRLWEMERATNRTHGPLSRIENGLSPYNQEVIEGYAEMCKCTPADIIGRDPNKHPDVFTMYSRLSHPEQDMVRSLIEVLLKKV